MSLIVGLIAVFSRLVAEYADMPLEVLLMWQERGIGFRGAGSGLIEEEEEVMSAFP